MLLLKTKIKWCKPIEVQVQLETWHRYQAWLKKSKPFAANDSTFVLYINIIDHLEVYKTLKYEIKSVQLYLTFTIKSLQYYA